MAEVEIHAGHGAHADAFGQWVGILVGIIGVLLAVVTILSHREHTAAVVHKTEANDQWAYYQAKKSRAHTDEVGNALLNALAPDPSRVADTAQKFSAEAARYAAQADDIQKDASMKDAESRHAEDRAIRFDLGEGLLELGVVMTSLYFLARRRLYVTFGVLAAIVGAAVGATGLVG
jgi:hypothetical protein